MKTATFIALLSVISFDCKADVSFEVSRNLYFSSFNHDDAAAVEAAASLEAEMIQNSRQILKWSQTQTEAYPDAGMYLVYTGMLILDRNNGLLEGELKNTDDRAHVIERYALAQLFLDQAIILAPDDERIESWNIANVLRQEKIENGQVSERTKDRVVALAEQMPIFHLFNALTLSSDVDFGPVREAKLLEIAELMSGKDSPCGLPFLRTGDQRKCNTTSKTPFAMHGTTLYFGDEFLKQSLKLADQSREQVDLYLNKALKMYERLNFFLFRGKTRRWDQSENLEARIELVKAVQNGGDLKQVSSYLKTRSYLDIYTCYSCHQNGYSRHPLQVSLPAAKRLGESE